LSKWPNSHCSNSSNLDSYSFDDDDYIVSQKQNDDDDEDAAIQLALQMSMQPDTDDTVPSTTNESSSQQQQFQDPQFVNQLLGSLPGVDENNPAVKSALENLKKSTEDKEKKDDSKNDK